MGTIRIGSRVVGDGCPVFIIAETGVNHCGDPDMARRLVDAAAAAGADAVKFQSFKAERVASCGARKADYQLDTTDARESQLEMLRRLELSEEAQRDVHAYCTSQGLVFLSTPFDLPSVDLLASLDVPAYKIGSGDVTNWPLLRHVARQRRPVILSTGMSYLNEVAEAVGVLRHAGSEKIVVLHCLSQYPAPPAEANLKVLGALRTALQLPVGYSDHTPGLEVAQAAVALGACVIEKHLTLDKALPGPDHAASLEPLEFRRLVDGIRTVEAALGDGLKTPAPSEAGNRAVVRRSLATATAIPSGSVIVDSMLVALRPGTGISPSLVDLVVGRRTRRALPTGALIDWADLD